MSYVTEEVDRVKNLFSEKEGRLTRERDASMRDALAATEDCKRLNEQLTVLRRTASSLEEQLEVRVTPQHQSSIPCSLYCQHLRAYRGLHLLTPTIQFCSQSCSLILSKAQSCGNLTRNALWHARVLARIPSSCKI